MIDVDVIYNQDCIAGMKTFPEECIDLIDDVVLDPFFGCGSTLIAAIQTKRHYIGFEIDPQYFDIACNWLDDVETERERESNNHLNSVRKGCDDK